MFKTILVANRGEIACRILRTLNRLKLRSIAIYSEADAHSLHVSLADRAVCVGPAPAQKSYLDAEAILATAEAESVDAIHPGYGFLSENAEFAEACGAHRIHFIGPSAGQIRAFGLKHSARELAAHCGVALLPGTGILQSAAEARARASAIGYPIMLKSCAGGGGIGLAVCRNEAELHERFEAVERISRNNFADGGVFLEKYLPQARHLEVQIFGDGRDVIALGVRDCSAQRRNQKVVEETPAPGLPADVESELVESAIALGRAVSYRSAGTVEFVFDVAERRAYFLEVNTRLQVEHAVTEAVTGVDLVEWMIRESEGSLPELSRLQPSFSGHSIEVRLYAEDPAKNFQPSSGLLTLAQFPSEARVETWVETGSEVTPFYDPLLAKLIVSGETREEAVRMLRTALASTELAGIETNLEYLRKLATSDAFERAELTTRSLSHFSPPSSTLEVLAPGTQSTVQDYPGRLGYWAVGIPPSGPMDHLALRLTNRILGNPEGTAGLELTVSGPKLRFNTDAVVALGGADMQPTLDGAPQPRWKPIQVRSGQVLELGKIRGPGCRSYLCVRGGFDVPRYLGSRSTFALGGFGGHAGRALRAGDVLHLGAPNSEPIVERELPAALVPKYEKNWRIGVLYGPHGAPDFFADADIETLFSAEWEVHYNSARTGVRLIGPKPSWARSDGGEAGLHPSNIHDTAYAIGTVNFTGDMPIILGPDGPSLGGFVCPVTIVKSELWKIGQLRPGDRVRFFATTAENARKAELAQDRALAELSAHEPTALSESERREPAILAETPQSAERVAVTYRRAGDRYLLVEYGPMVLDLELRFRVHALMTRLESEALPGIVDLTPGIRSLQIHHAPDLMSEARLLAELARIERELGSVDSLEVATRIVHLPLSWDDPAAALAVRKYAQLVRKDAPWAPSNIEFIRRINGLSSVEEVERIVFDASYLVLGLGDVYLGAPVATPIDPRHRLVTTKYNPARTWTPENAVGIGGAYLCIYGMEGPGGYQLVGRTLQVYNRFRQTADFEPGKPWLLRFFDQIRFYPVSASELEQLRQDFSLGRFTLKTETETFRLREYRRFLDEERESIAAFKARQQAAFEAERQRWIETGQLNFSADPPSTKASDDADGHVCGRRPEAGLADGHVCGRRPEAGLADAELPPGLQAVPSPVPGSVWKIAVTEGHRVARGDTLVVVESMKMEIVVEAPCAGTVTGVMCAEGRAVSAGQTLLVVQV